LGHYGSHLLRKSVWQIFFNSLQVCQPNLKQEDFSNNMLLAWAIHSCPGGPVVQTLVGRPDRNTPNPEGLIPNPRSPAPVIIANMSDKGINSDELVALLGAHSTARQFVFDPARAGTPLDPDPQIWDVRFYGGVLDNTNPFILPSDRVISQFPATTGLWHEFAGNQQEWARAFAPA
jgi:hypothetical protein